MKNEIIKIADDLRNGEIDSETAQNLLLGLFGVRRRSVLELRNDSHSFFDWVNYELGHLRKDEDDYIQDWFEQYKEYEDENEEDMLSSLQDWIPYCLAQKMYEYGFDMNKYGYFSFA